LVLPLKQYLMLESTDRTCPMLEMAQTVYSIMKMLEKCLDFGGSTLSSILILMYGEESEELQLF
jgi:hypothetical protein